MSKRNAKRLEQVRSLPCCHCGASPRSQAAHSNFSEHGKGMGTKADDEYTVPLCHSCHSQLDQYNMGMSKNESIAWFENRLKFVNGVLNDINKGETSVF